MKELSQVYPWTHAKATPTSNKWVVLVPCRIPDAELEGIKDIGLRPSTVAMFTKGHWCAYTAIPKGQLPRAWRDGGYTHKGFDFLNIHGGITYSGSTQNFVIYGLDCGHAGDDKNELLFNPDHVQRLGEQMRQQILKFASIQKTYRRAKFRKKVRLLDEVRATGKLKEEFGFGANLAIIFGAGDSV